MARGGGGGGASPTHLLHNRGAYPRPSFAPAKQPRERGRGLAERGYPRRKPPRSPDRDPRRGTAVPHRTRTGRPGRVHPPPRRPGSNHPDRLALRFHRARAPTPGVRFGHRHVPRVSGCRSFRPASARTTSRSPWPRSWRSRNGRPSSGSGRAGRSSRRWPGRPGHHHRSGPPRDDHELLRPRWVSRGRRLRGGRGAHRGRGAARSPLPRRSDGDGTGVLRGAGASHPAVAHPLP